MSYYFPFGGANSISVLNVSFSFAAVTSSTPSAVTVRALTASYATTSGSVPTAGTNGTNKTSELCGSSTEVGPQGVQGPIGTKGSDNNTCPDGTVECTQLTPSLSMALPGFPNGINFVRPSGSKFSKVCMQIPTGCTPATAVCPPYLPTASITSTFPSIA